MAKTLTSVNPATLEDNGEVHVASPKQVEAAVEAARQAQPDWQALDVKGRLEVLERFKALLVDEALDVATTTTRETGKPLGEAVAADVYPVVDAVRFVADEGPGVLRERVPVKNPLAMGRKSTIVRDPVGVVGLITPWNYPLAIPGSQAVYALFAGNACVLKPATETPLTADRLADLLARAGVPDGVFQVVHGPGSSTGQALADADVDHLVFTGSRKVGWDLYESCADRGVGCCLELGGSDPAVVLDDADLGLTAEAVAWSRFTNAGQTCAAIKRVVPVDAVADGLTRMLVDKAEKLRVGDPLADGGATNGAGVDVGPMISAEARDRLHDQVQTSVEMGAEVLCGGEPVGDLDGHFYQPTVLANVTPDMPVATEETFGPALAVLRADDEDDAVRLANATEFGLSASVWTRDLDRGRRVARRLEAGTVTVNDHLYTYALNETPWGGVKTSGHGLTHGTWGLMDVTRAKHLHVGRARRDLWWFPYPDDQAELMADGLKAMYGKGLGRLAKLPKMLGRMRGKEGL